jgi:hypothetical protein
MAMDLRGGGNAVPSTELLVWITGEFTLRRRDGGTDHSNAWVDPNNEGELNLTFAAGLQS